MTLLMDTLNEAKNGLDLISSKLGPVRTDCVSCRNVRTTKRVQFERIATVVENTDYISEEERVQTWWQKEDYFGFKWQIDVQLQALRNKLRHAIKEVILLAEQATANVHDDEELEIALRDLNVNIELIQWCRSSYRGLENLSSHIIKEQNRRRICNLTKITVVSAQLQSNKLRILESQSRFHRLLARMLGAADAMVLSVEPMKGHSNTAACLRRQS